MKQIEKKETIDQLLGLEYHYFDAANHETENLTEDYHKHLCLTIASKARELRLLIQSEFTDKTKI